MKDLFCTVRSVERIAADIVDMRMCPAEPVALEPGHFAHLAVPGGFLRRPISIADAEDGGGGFRVLVQVVGAGTRALTALAPGDGLRALLPLGRPFPMAEIRALLRDRKRVWLVGGGIGLAPLLHVAVRLAREGAPRAGLRAFAGFRDTAHAYTVEELRACAETTLAVGGFVTDSFLEALRDVTPDLVLACGPTPLLKALQAVCGERGIPAYASLEERMGCGLGACLVCNCGLRDPDDPGRIAYRRVCRDGPVFPLSEVVFP